MGISTINIKESTKTKSVNYRELWNHYLKCCKVMDREPDIANDMVRYFNL